MNRDIVPRRPARRSSGHSDAGFTLTELAIGLTLAAIAATVIFNVFLSSRGSFYDTQEIVNHQSDSRAALSLMAQDLRASGAAPGDPRVAIPFERIAVAQSDTIRVQSDLNGNGAIDPGTEPPEDVTWYWNRDDEALMRRTTAGEFPIARDVTFFGMNYVDADGAELDTFPLDRETRRSVRAVELFLNVRFDEGDQRMRSVMIFLRNDDLGT